MKKLGVNCLVCIGGDGTLTIAYRLFKDGMGHLQRGGSPTASDRVLGTGLGTKTVDMIEGEEFGYMAGVQRNSIVKVSLEKVAQGTKTVPLDHPLIKAARSLGTCFGD